MNEQWVEDFQEGYYIGIMSGTSLDGVDLVLCRFGQKTELLGSHSVPFDDELQSILMALCYGDGIKSLPNPPLEDASELDYFGWASVKYARLCAESVKQLITKMDIDEEEVMAIGCHGQTVRHRPAWQFSLQLLDPNVLAEQTGITVVSDFRRRDMAVGGQGAPLIPAFHQAMFHVKQHADVQIVVLNLGGIANITVLGEQVIGYDTGVANLLMDGWIARHLGKAYDKNGEWASSGTVSQSLLDELLKHPFLMQSAPKSTGREEFNLVWLDGVLKNFNLNNQDIQATLCEFTALTVANEVKKYQRPQNVLYVCGGGAYNIYLLSRLQEHLPNWEILTTETVGVSPSWVEAMGFAWLARQTILGEPANLPAVTGATKAVVLGQVCFA